MCSSDLFVCCAYTDQKVQAKAQAAASGVSFDAPAVGLD